MIRTHSGKASEYKDSDLEYMRSLSAAVVQRSPKNFVMVVLIIAATVLASILWMNWAEIDVVVRGDGKVIPSRQVQVVQSLEGGVVSEILVNEGDIVKINEPLIKLSDVAFSSSFQENLILMNELKARVLRLQAESTGDDFNLSDADQNLDDELVSAERSLFVSNAEQLAETLSIHREQIAQQQSALEEAQSKSRRIGRSLELLEKEIEIKEPLMRNRIISEVEFLQLKQREAELRGELEIADISIPRIRSAIEEVRGKLEQSRLDFRNKAKRELNENVAELSRVAETQAALEDRVTRTTLRSPVNGIVKQLHTNTIGGVINPGNKVVEIVPAGDRLLVEVQIKPADIASIDVGQRTRLKFSAYDFAIHGSLGGVVVFVSADTVTDEEGRSYYIVRVRPETPYLDELNAALPIKVGMTSEADIITHKKSILDYLLKPINRGLQRALSES